MEFRPGETNILCRDLEASCAFYCDVLGFVVLERDGEALRLACQGRPFLLLPIAGKPRLDEAYNARACVSFDLLVADVRAAEAYLLGRGVAFAEAWEPGRSYVVIKDPDGLCIEVVA